MLATAFRTSPRISGALLERFEAQRVTLDFAPAIPVGDAPPTEFRVFQAGTHDSQKGKFTFDATSAKEVMARYQERGIADLPLDWGHAMLNDETYADPAEAGKASGWFKLAVRQSADGPELWAVDVRYTPLAQKKFAEKEYRFFSPAFLHKSGHILDLINVALTNTPATYGQEPLVRASRTSSDDQEKPMKLVLSALKLSDNASEAEALSVVQRLADGERKLLTAIGAANVDEAVGKAVAFKTAHEQLETLKKEHESLKLESAQREVRGLVKRGIKEGKIPPAQKLAFRKMGAAELKAFLKTAVPVVTMTGKDKSRKRPGTATEPRVNDAEPAEVQLTKEDLEVAKATGVKLEDLKKRKAEAQGLRWSEHPAEDEDDGTEEEAAKGKNKK